MTEKNGQGRTNTFEDWIKDKMRRGFGRNVRYFEKVASRDLSGAKS
jgi:hypothetical protein